jgi:phosphonate transport system substrate-binding protein
MIWRRNVRKLLIAAVAALSVLVGSATTLGSSSEFDQFVHLRFGLYTSSTPSTLVKQFKPILNKLEESMTQKLDIPVDITINMSRSYESGVTALVNGRADFSRFGPASYLEALERNPDLELIAMETEENKKVFYGIIAVRAGSDIEAVADLKGRSFAFGDEGSTIGRFLSQLFLANSDIHSHDLERYEYLGQHDLVGLAVASGEFDAGALNEKTFNKLVEAGQPLVELARFENVTKPWIATSGMDPRVLQALRESLLEIDPAASVLTRLKVTGFAEGTKEEYNTIRDSIDLNDLFFLPHE